MTFSRRVFVKAGGLACAGLSVAPLSLVRARRPVLVTIHLRGGADGLALLVPYRDPQYYAARPRIAIPPRDVLDLDGRFGLPPALAPLLPLWRERKLAAVVAVGSAQPPPGHADARRALEADVPVLRATTPGTAFAAALRHVARLIKAGNAPRIARLALGGWDTHVDQGAQRGRLAARLGTLARGLAGFAGELGPRLRDVVVVTWTEFGRSVRENANGGTDHGGASTALVLGDPLLGGHVVGRWPGLAAAAGLAGTTGVPDLMADILARHAGADAGSWPRA